MRDAIEPAPSSRVRSIGTRCRGWQLGAKLEGFVIYGREEIAADV